MPSDLALFAQMFGKVGVMTGIGPGIVVAFCMYKFGTGAQRPGQSESGLGRGSNLRDVSDSLSASSKNLRTM
jgi:hypothetical protein